MFDVATRVQSASRAATVVWKADVDSAYRRVPICPRDRWAAHVAFLFQGVPYIARHNALMFGSVSAVHGWNRIGQLLAFLALHELSIPALRYVDDFFCAERSETANHAVSCFVQLVRVLLGHSAIADHKTCVGNPLEILGLDIFANLHGMRCMPREEKLFKWRSVIEHALSQNQLMPGIASKLAGALSWATQAMFRRIGRAMLRPLFRHKSRYGTISWQLRLCLRWWL